MGLQIVGGFMRYCFGTFLLFLVLALAACRPPGPAGETEDGADSSLVIRGTLTSEGVECPAMRGPDGALYTLAGRNTGGFKSGDKVCVRGRRAEMSFCMQGITIEVISIGPEKDCP